MRRSMRVIAIGVPLGGGALVDRHRDRAVDASDQNPPEAPWFEQLESRLLMAATRVTVIGSSSVEGIVGANSFRRPLYKQLVAAGYDVNFIGSKNTNADGSTPPNPDFDRDNEGHGGWRADSFLSGDFLKNKLAGNSSDGVAYTPDVAIIYVGHNDIFSNQTAATTASEISQIIDVLRADNPNVKIILGQLHFTLWSSPGYKQVSNPDPNTGIADLNSRLATLAQNKSTSASPVVTTNVNAGWDPSVYTSDGQHATSAGEDFIADKFIDTLVDNRFLAGGVTVTPTSGLVTTEAGAKAFFSVVLNSKPTSDVTINLSSSDTSEGSINKATLVFTPQNWDTAQTVAVTGVDDSVRDGDKPYTITLSNTKSDDAAFDGLSVSNVTLTNDDDEGAISGTAFIDDDKDGVKDSGETTLANVTVFLDLNNNGKINEDEPVRTTNTSGAYTFDNLSAGTYHVRVVIPEGYMVSPKGKSLHTIDAGGGDVDTANFALAIEPGQVLITPTTGLETSEGGGKSSFSVILSKPPTANVSVTLASSDTTEGVVNKTTLVFTPANWNTAQIVTITGVNDDIFDGDKTFTITTSAATSSDRAYSGVSVADLSVTNHDNEAAIQGTLFHDLNGDGDKDSGESAFAGVTVFRDANGNGKLDAGEDSSVTDSAGKYSFAPVAAGNHAIRVIPPSGYIVATGNGSLVTASGGTTTTRDFALVKPTDTAGNTLDTALNLDQLATIQTIDEYLTAEDRVDIYRIRLRRAGQLRIRLRNLDAAARVQLLDKSGRRLRTADRQIDADQLRKGVYFIRIATRDGLDTPYRLRLVRKNLA